MLAQLMVELLYWHPFHCECCATYRFLNEHAYFSFDLVFIYL